MKRKNLEGQRFERLTVIEWVKREDKPGKWLCQCDCGNITLASSSRLLNGHRTSCGCARTKHGYTSKEGISPEYRAWNHMKDRCYNPNNTRYNDYGGRGITVCEAWRNSFEEFIADVGNRPNKFSSLDRINNEGNYEPGNVRWTSSTNQASNRRISSRNTSGVAGVGFFEGKWYARIAYNKKSKHLGRFDSFDDAVKARLAAEEERDSMSGRG